MGWSERHDSNSRAGTWSGCPQAVYRIVSILLGWLPLILGRQDRDVDIDVNVWFNPLDWWPALGLPRYQRSIRPRWMPSLAHAFEGSRMLRKLRGYEWS